MADKRFSLMLDASMDISQIMAAVKKVQTGFDSLNINAVGQKSFNKLFLDLENAIRDFESKAGKEITNMGDVKGLEKSFGTILNLYDRLKLELKSLTQLSDTEILKLFPETLGNSFKDAIKALTDYEKKVDEIESKIQKKREQRQDQERKRDKAKQKDPTKGKKVMSSSEMDDLKRQKREVQKAKAEVEKEIQQMEQEIQRRINEGSMKLNKNGTADKRQANAADNQKLLDDLAKAKQRADELANTFNQLDSAIKGGITQTDYEANLKKIQAEAKAAEDEIARLEAEMASMKADPSLTQDFEKLKKEIETITGLDLSNITYGADSLKQLKQILENFKADKIKEVRDSTDGVEQSADGAAAGMGKLKGKMEEVRSSAKTLDYAAQDVDRITYSIMHFFSLSNAIRIFKNAVKDAFNTVKELDAAMTQTAVVTDYDVGDMWSQLPEYTKAANELGTTTLGAYETMTLFYQQGLQTNEAFAIGTETMKMARIAGMEYADATDKMTAALRGFNMELNETSAQRINDVYSKLAAITAADTNEIATAMTKTASIADSANMEFETTAAFLSQIIETTRESAETAGTAMKTVIARFQELKKDPSEIGEVDGEIVDANKIETALRSVGVALRDSEGQFRDLDDVFLELSSKWNSLDTNTQRYIATIAAGSRQQSRFIAMMSNYSRTMELVSAANNSAGASQKQFEKTLESMETKLNQLKNAWDQFVMGLTNSSLLKAGVDILTNLLNTINSITNLGSEGLGGTVTSILRLGTVLLGLRAGNAIFTSFTRNFRALSLDSAGKFIGYNFGGAIAATFKDGVKFFGGLVDKVKTFAQVMSSPALRGVWLAGLVENFKALAKSAGSFFSSIGKLLLKFGPQLLLIAAAIAAIVVVVKEFKAAQLENQIAALNEQASRFGETANEAEQELNEIADSRTKLQTLEGELKNLTKGTDEWKAALAKVNKEVLSLVEKFPTLEIITGADGQLSITDESWDNLIATQQQIIVNASNALKGVQAEIGQLSKELDLEKFIVNSDYSTSGKEKTDFDKWSDQATYDFVQFLDKEILWGLLTWGDIVAGVSAFGYSATGNSRGAAQAHQDNQRTKDSGGYTEQHIRAVTGMSSEQIMSLASDFARYGITFSDGLTDEEVAKAWDVFSLSGFDVKDMNTFNALIDKAASVGKEFDNLGATMLQHDQILSKQSRDFVKNAISNTKTANKEYADAISNVLGGGQFKDLSQAIEEAEGQITESGKDLKERYAGEFGYYFNGKDVYKDSSFTQKMEISADDMKKALATAMVTAEVKVSTENLEKILLGMTKEQRDLFTQIFSTSGSGITTATLDQLNGTTSLDQIAAMFNYDDAAEMAEAFNMEVEELAVLLTDNFTAAIDRIQKSRQDATSKLAKISRESKKAGQSEEEFLVEQATRLKSLEERFGENIRFSIENIYNKLSATGDEAIATEGLKAYLRIAEDTSLDTAIAKGRLNDIEKFVNQVDWSNPIEAAHRLRQEIEYGSGASIEYARNLLEVGKSAFGATAQLNYFINSASFTELAGEIDEIIDKNGQLTASNILEMADSYSDLEKIMANTGTTASGLAAAFTALRKGEIGIHQLTDTVIASLSGISSADDIISKVLKSISEFDPGQDENAVSEFINSAFEAIDKNLQKGAVGNSQNFNYLDYIFGPDWDKGANGEELVGNALIKRMDYLMGILNKNKENMFASWKDFAKKIEKGKDIYGNAMEFDPDSGRSANDFGISVKNGEVTLTGYEGKTSEEIVDWIADAYNVSHEYAGMMLTDLKNYSIDLARELDQNDYTAGIQKAYESLNSIQVRPTMFGPTEKKVIDYSEIEAIANFYKKNIDDVYAYFQEKGAVITEFYDKDGVLKDTDEILSQIAEKSGYGNTDQWVKQFTEDISPSVPDKTLPGMYPNGPVAPGSHFISPVVGLLEDGFEIPAAVKLDMDGLNQQMDDFNIPQSARSNITQGVVDSLFEAGNETVYIEATLSDGSTQEIALKAGDSVETAINNAEIDMQNNRLATAIAEAFGKVEINVANLTETGELIKTTIKGDGYEVEVTCTEASLAALTGAIDGAITEVDGNITVVADADASKVQSAIDKLNGQTIGINIGFNWLSGGPDKHAKGIKNSPTGHPALVSEEGPELIQTKDGAYLTGQNGPELAYINKGDTVYTAEETKRILQGKQHQSIPRFEGGIHGYGYTDYDWGYDGDSGGKSSSKSKEEVWENSFDKLFVILKQIEESERERERIERRYEALLNSINISANGILNLSRQEISALQAQKERQKSLISGREGQIQKYQEEHSEYKKYAWFEENEYGEQVLRIDWDAINGITDKEEGEKVEEYVKQLEEWADEIYDANEELEKIEAEIEDIKKRGQQEYNNLETQIKDALVNSYQKEIDELSNINDSINDTNSALLDAIQSSVDKMRQERENEKTEQDLADKQRRLIYLQQDTSGANQQEILQLQKEIEEGTQDYTDTLIDQKINALQEQNDKAAQQREQQIAIAQAQLDHYVQSGEIWNEVYDLMRDGLSEENGLVRGSKLAEILQDAANFSGLSAIGQQNWWTDFNNMVAQGLAYLKLGRQLEDIGVKSGTIEFYDEQGNLVTGTVDEKGNVTTSDGKVYEDVYQGYDGKYYAGSKPKEPEKKPEETEEPEKKKPKLTKEIKKGVSAAIWHGGFGWGHDPERKKRLKEVFGENDIQANYVNKRVMSGYPGKVSDYSYENMKKKFTQYKTGGIADFTGPAWLDGTKTKPELILNAKDTQNFIQLKNVLASFMSGVNQTHNNQSNSENSGEITYDIDINVESIAGDYDVEQLANKIKSLINSDARYRNNSAISLTR